METKTRAEPPSILLASKTSANLGAFQGLEISRILDAGEPSAFSARKMLSNLEQLFLCPEKCSKEPLGGLTESVSGVSPVSERSSSRCSFGKQSGKLDEWDRFTSWETVSVPSD
jgi:hypothetical protein